MELAPAFEGDLEEQQRFLDQAGIDSRCHWTSEDTRITHHAWQLHIAVRSSDILPKRPIADVLIGAYASNRRGLITRNPSDFRRNFPNLQILEP